MTDDRRPRPDDRTAGAGAPGERPAVPGKPVPPVPVKPVAPVPVVPAGAAPARPAAPVPAKPVPPTPVKPVAPVPVAPAGAAPVKPVAPVPAKPVAPVPATPTAVPLSSAPTPPVAPTPVPAAPTPAVKPAVPAKPAAPKAGADGKRAAGPAPGAAAAAPPPDPRIGTTIGRCRLLERIGQGRTAVVYRAHHEGLGIDVAVKILLPQVLQFPEVVAKFEQEARAIARLDHPNVLKIYDVVREGDAHGIVMELLEGEDVLEYLQAEGGRVDPQDALRIVRQAAAGLQAAHAKGIIHRDVKPQNLVILEDGTVKVVDFGLATTGDASMAAVRIGTPHYMSPEACEAKPVEPASDVYGLGISLYHLLVGQPPYAGQGLKEILASHVAGKPLQPEKHVKGLAAELADLVRAMTKRDPLTRASADAVIATIDRIGGQELVASLKLKPRRSRHHVAARRKTSSGPVVLAVLGAIALVVVLVAMLAKKSPPTEPTRVPPEPAPEVPPEPVPAPTPGAGPEAPPTPETPPPESPEVRRRREELENARKQAEAKDAFAVAEAFAREHEADVPAVVRAYRSVATSYPRTESGRAAKLRADGIEKGEVHPHPDKTFAPKTVVDRVRELWDEAKPQVEAAVQERRYEAALALLPAGVEDPDRALTKEIELWRAVLRRMPGFLKAFETHAPSLKAGERGLATPKGPGSLVRVSTSGPSVQVGKDVLDLRWADVPAEGLAELASKAFTGKDAALQEDLAAFAWLHRVRGIFYETALGVKLSGATGPGPEFVSKLLATAKERFGS